MPIKSTAQSSQLSFPIAFAALALGGLVMGFSPVFVREAEVGAFASAFWRVLFALPLLFAWYYWERKPNQPLSWRMEKSAIAAGILFAGDLTFWHLSILNTTMANATFTVCLSVVWVALFSNLLLGEKIYKRAWIGLFICLAGLALLVQSSLSVNPQRLIGDIYGIITSVFLGLYFIAMRAGRKTKKSGELFLTSTLVTCLVLFLVAIFSGDTLTPQTTKGWFSLFSLGVFTHAGGQGLVTIALGSLSAMFSSLVIFIEALAAAVFGWWLFDEAMTSSQLIGGLLIMMGVWLARPVAH